MENNLRYKVKKYINNIGDVYMVEDLSISKHHQIIMNTSQFKEFVELVGVENISIDIIDNKQPIEKDRPLFRQVWEH